MTTTTKTTRQRDPLYDAVAHRVQSLQAQFLKDEPHAVATLARLRRCDPADVGAEPLVWSVTLDGLPDEVVGPRHGDDPTPAERAVHASLVLYALHQQSGDEGVHQPGVSLGLAVGRLARARAHEEDLDPSTIKRFHQVSLANDFAGRLHFLRGVIQLMRAESPPIGLDYGLLALDLRDLADERRSPDRVLFRWGRDLHFNPKTTNQETT
ncbi:MAG: type I-E CRISPR-associated protein Cse2/CasB [Cumulibacter sp.]